MTQSCNSSGVSSENGDRFHYSSYWRTWSRILSEGRAGRNLAIVEVDLTAINPESGFGWIQTRTINIREHMTARSRDDLIVDVLPGAAVDLMRAHMDESLVSRLLHEDFMQQIDWNKYQAICNGGAAFDKIKKLTSNLE